MCNPFGGGSKATQTSTQAASNATSVVVNVPINTDVTPLANAIDALRGSTQSTAAASAAILAGALTAQSKTLAAAIQTSSGNSGEIQILVAVIGLLGALFAAHVLKL